MASDLPTAQYEKQQRDLHRITEEYGEAARELSNNLKAFKKHLLAMHHAARRLRVGFSLSGTPSEDDVTHLVGLEIGRILGTDWALFSFAEFTVAALTAPERIPALPGVAASTGVALAKALGASYEQRSKRRGVRKSWPTSKLSKQDCNKRKHNNAAR